MYYDARFAISDGIYTAKCTDFRYVNILKMCVVIGTSLIIRQYNEWPIRFAFHYFLTNIRLFVRK